MCIIFRFRDGILYSYEYWYTKSKSNPVAAQASILRSTLHVCLILRTSYEYAQGLILRQLKLKCKFQVESEGKLYSVPDEVEMVHPAPPAKLENWWKVGPRWCFFFVFWDPKCATTSSKQVAVVQ